MARGVAQRAGIDDRIEAPVEPLMTKDRGPHTI